MEIPKIIHYVWVGGKPKPKIVNKCIESWKKKLPSYEIKEWNESNFDINSVKYVKEAYEAKKYAFVSDYIRLYALYHYGGIYFDTDIEVLKNEKILEKYFSKSNIFSFESDKSIMTGMMAAEKNSKIIKEFMEIYSNLVFKDLNGNIDITPNTRRLTNLLLKKDLKLNESTQESDKYNYIVYESGIFSSYDMYNNSYQITDKSISVHHFSGSWLSKRKKAIIYIKKKIKRIIR